MDLSNRAKQSFSYMPTFTMKWEAIMAKKGHDLALVSIRITLPVGMERIRVGAADIGKSG